jgi:hypothetical protein
LYSWPFLRVDTGVRDERGSSETVNPPDGAVLTGQDHVVVKSTINGAEMVERNPGIPFAASDGHKRRDGTPRDLKHLTVFLRDENVARGEPGKRGL